MPRFFHVLVLMMAFAISGAPAWISELLRDDCADECTSDDVCPDEGCADCSLLCSACPRTHVIAAQAVAPSPLDRAVTRITTEHGSTVPTGPPPRGVFHPPRQLG